MSKVSVANYKCRGCGQVFTKEVKKHELPDPMYVKVWMKANLLDFHNCGPGLTSLGLTGVGDLVSVGQYEG
jgi:hypothetical protein